jgi:hypothetical protein
MFLYSLYFQLFYAGIALKMSLKLFWSAKISRRDSAWKKNKDSLLIQSWKNIQNYIVIQRKINIVQVDDEVIPRTHSIQDET